MIYSIVKYGDPVLETQTATITEFDTPELHKLLDDMFESMYAAKGVGLAAPQIGIGKRIAVVDLSVGEDPEKKIVLINPEVIHREGSQQSEEGCLSLPGYGAKVPRALRVRVECLNERAEPVVIEAEGWYARILQHEIGHLRGDLYIDHMDSRTFSTQDNHTRHGKA